MISLRDYGTSIYGPRELPPTLITVSIQMFQRWVVMPVPFFSFLLLLNAIGPNKADRRQADPPVTPIIERQLSLVGRLSF